MRSSSEPLRNTKPAGASQNTNNTTTIGGAISTTLRHNRTMFPKDIVGKVARYSAVSEEFAPLHGAVSTAEVKTLVDRLYTPSTLRERTARDQEARLARSRSVHYDSIDDQHLGAFWARQRKIKSRTVERNKNILEAYDAADAGQEELALELLEQYRPQSNQTNSRANSRHSTRSSSTKQQKSSQLPMIKGSKQQPQAPAAGGRPPRFAPNNTSSTKTQQQRRPRDGEEDNAFPSHSRSSSPSSNRSSSRGSSRGSSSRSSPSNGSRDRSRTSSSPGTTTRGRSHSSSMKGSSRNSSQCSSRSNSPPKNVGNSSSSDDEYNSPGSTQHSPASGNAETKRHSRSSSHHSKSSRSSPSNSSPSTPKKTVESNKSCRGSKENRNTAGQQGIEDDDEGEEETMMLSKSEGQLVILESENGDSDTTTLEGGNELSSATLDPLHQAQTTLHRRDLTALWMLASPPPNYQAAIGALGIEPNQFRLRWLVDGKTPSPNISLFHIPAQIGQSPSASTRSSRAGDDGRRESHIEGDDDNIVATEDPSVERGGGGPCTVNSSSNPPNSPPVDQKNPDDVTPDGTGDNSARPIERKKRSVRYQDGEEKKERSEEEEEEADSTAGTTQQEKEDEEAVQPLDAFELMEVENFQISSPRSIVVLMRNGVSVKDILPRPLMSTYKTASLEGRPSIIAERRYAAQEQGRVVLLEKLRKDYSTMCSSISQRATIQALRVLNPNVNPDFPTSFDNDTIDEVTAKGGKLSKKLSFIGSTAIKRQMESNSRLANEQRKFEQYLEKNMVLTMERIKDANRREKRSQRKRQDREAKAVEDDQRRKEQQVARNEKLKRVRLEGQLLAEAKRKKVLEDIALHEKNTAEQEEMRAFGRLISQEETRIATEEKHLNMARRDKIREYNKLLTVDKIRRKAAKCDANAKTEQATKLRIKYEMTQSALHVRTMVDGHKDKLLRYQRRTVI